MRILLIITDYGSFNNFLSELAMQLVANEHEVHVICSPAKVINVKDKFPYEQVGIVFHHVNFPRSFNLFKQLGASREINRKIAEIKPYLINIHFTTAIFSTMLWRKPSYFTIGTFHGVGYSVITSGVKRRIFKAVEKFCFKKLDQIYLINAADYEMVKELYPDKTFLHTSVGLGSDLEKFDPFAISPQFRGILRHKLLIREDDFVLAFTGRFTAFKGFHLVIKAFNSLINQYRLHDIKLLIIGGEDPIHPNGLTEKESLEYRNNSHIIKVDFTRDVNHYLSISDLFVFPSEKEGMPVCIMEALSMGVPVITTASRGCSDLVQHAFNGVIVKNNPSVSELREAILRLYRDRELLAELSKNALSKRSDFSRQKYIDDQIDVYHKTPAQIQCA